VVETPIHLLRPAALPPPLAGVAAVLVLGSAVPVWRASRLDPVDILERR
jgi:ABC-type antimicrobial peptide transport system permease subunit